VVFVLGALRAAIIHADPHPDDVLVLDDGRLALLDFGATGTMQTDRVDAAAAAVEAFAADDPDQFGAALERLGALPASQAPSLLDLMKHALGELADTEPARLDSDAVLAVCDRLFARPGPLSEVIRAGAMPLEDLWPARGAAQLFASIARVGATGPWRGLVRAALRDGWAANVDSTIAYES
jgi:hypothetical protein